MSENSFISVNPDSVPKKKLFSGDEIPVVGLGTFGSDRYSHSEVANAVKEAIRMGYRHIDCAAVYMNEKQIGDALAEVISEGIVTREELWITSKVWNDRHDDADIACQESLDDLQLDYLDLYLIHWPFRNYHAPGCDGDARNPDSKPFNTKEYLATWRQLESLVELGRVRNIGTSNMTIPKFKAVLSEMHIKPAVNEMEIHPCFQQQELFDFCTEHKIQPIGFSPIGSPSRPERDRAEGDAVDTEHPVVQKIADRLNVHPAVVCIKWAVQRGQVTIPFSVHANKFMSNLEAATKDPLTETEMEEMKSVECNSRLIKGQVFLWEGARSWEDLWDLDGVIVS